MERSAGRSPVEKRPSNLEITEAAVTAAAGVETAETSPSEVPSRPAAAFPVPDPSDSGRYRAVFSCASCPPDTPTKEGES